MRGWNNRKPCSPPSARIGEPAPEEEAAVAADQRHAGADRPEVGSKLPAWSGAARHENVTLVALVRPSREER